MAIEVRRALPAEYEEAGRVTALAYREFVRPEDGDWNDYLDRIADVRDRAGRTVVLVAVEDGRILGSATLELEGRTEEGEPPVPPDEAHLRMLGVHPDARRRGIARMLMDASVEEARRAGKHRLTLNTTRRMRAAQSMYEALGFERLDDRVFPDGFVLLGYEKRLDA
ncbi:MAG: GNAT family N-acetyltransferase [Actinobacteria bacterium]|nr:MAG: GNAT family N-acetyltransferase [Actinomycetota bacterium]TMK68196.1 MAG: GNAT family N-acetyltransferase [Actinomycetota bacterium]